MRLAFATLMLSSSFVACSDPPPNDDNETYDCESETRDDEFHTELEKIGAGNALDFKLMEADPAPPMRGDNKWQVQITSMAGGAGLTGGTLTVIPFMPDHQHGSPIKVTITESGAGMYELDRVNMWMPGLWETTITAASGGTSDSAVYKFCIPN